MSTAPALAIIPIDHPLQATVRVPGSKSLTNRALVIAALADGPTTLTNALFSDDSQYCMESLRRLGFTVQADEQAHSITVTGQGGRIPAASAELFIGYSGTASRFLTALTPVLQYTQRFATSEIHGPLLPFSLDATYKARLLGAVNPAQTLPKRVYARVTAAGTLVAPTAGTTVVAHPTFRAPMGARWRGRGRARRWRDTAPPRPSG